MSFTEDGNSDADISDSFVTDTEDSENEINRPGNLRNGPWFTIIEPNSFVIDRLPSFSPDHGPVGFDANLSPYDYFEKFISEDDNSLFDIIVEETNRYATTTLNANDPTPQGRGNNWKPVSKQELSAFFGLLLAMGIVRKPSYASYWENGNKNALTYTPNFPQIMSRNRFQEILRFLHCNDNALAVERGQAGYDPLHKVANIIEFFNRTFEENYRLSQNVCIDERMIGFKGRHFLKQYIANKKAHRWGVKAWVLAESGSGYTHQLELYKGKSNAPRHPDGQGFPRSRNYDVERNRERLVGEEPSSHPLKSITVVDFKKTDKKSTTPSKNEKKPVSSSVIKDPLSSMLDPLSASLEGSDPLSQMSIASSSLPTTGRKSSFKESAETDGLDETFEPWSVKKSSILTKYSTSEKLSITTSFLSSSDKEKVAMRPSTTTTVTDKVRNRLEQLDDFEEGSVQEMLNLSQQDYVNRIDELNQALIDAWQHDQRVKALKIAIQCSKLLADTSVLPFYPSKFVLITDILDTFGRLVYDRLKEKAVYIPAGSGVPLKLPDNFTPDQVPESAKETCRNWFFKIASIRELIPRFYVETAILKCYSYLNNQEYTDAIDRLCVMTRGIGDPLVAIYAKCYLCRVGILIAPKTRDHILPCYEDFLATYSQVQKDAVQNTLAMQKIEMPRYLTLFSPALDWLLQCIANKSTEKTLMDILEKSRKQCNNALLLNSIISAFKPEYIASRSTQFIELIRESEEAGFPKHLLDRTLGLCLVMASPPEEQRLPVLNEVWKSIMKLKNPSDYIDCAEVWTEYVVKHFGKREINTILADIIKHMTPDRVFEDYYPQLQSVVTKIMCHITNFSMLFSLDKFLPFIDMFQKESVRVDVCKTIMESFNKTQLEPTNDPVIVNALMFICKTMHDSVNALTLEDERKMISNLISGFVRKISFGRDFEQQLSFYVEARSNFTNLDMVLIELVQNVNNLSIDTRKVVKGNHSRKTGNFVRACAAYCFITVPSLQSQTSQLQLYLLSGQVALLNQCFSQADSFFKAAISLIPDVPKDLTQDGKKRQSEPVLQEYICNFLSTLLTVPDNPDSGVLYLLRGLLNILQNYTSDSDFKSNIYVRVLAVLSAVCQESYPYHVDKVDSNDSMYGSDPKFTADVRGICSTLLEEVLNHLKSLHTAETLRRQSQLALELFNTIVHHGDVTKPSMFALALNLWNLAQKHGECDTKQTVRSLDAVKKKAAVLNIKEYTDLVNKMALESRT